VVGPVDLDALVNYIGSLAQPFNATIEGRITRLN
jgi:5'-nucleotidase